MSVWLLETKVKARRGSDYGTLVLRSGILSLGERFAHGRKKFFVVKRFDEKGNGADGHCGGPRGQVIARGNHNHAGARRDGTHARENFQTGHPFHPDVGDYNRDGMIGRMGQKLFRFIKRVYGQSIGCEQILHRSKDG